MNDNLVKMKIAKSKTSGTKRPSFYIKTFGCQMNKNDSDIIECILEDDGFKRVEVADDADIFLVNTCSVRVHAEQRALGYISTLKKWREQRGRVLGVVGCMATRLKSEITQLCPFVDLVLGPDSYRRLPEYIRQVTAGETKIVETAAGKELYDGISRRSGRASDYVSITRGCSNYCTYCIVPFVRGGLRSRPVDDIMREVQELISCGVKDITLLGQNVNEYLRDGVDFARLLETIACLDNLVRLRFLTSHPKDFTTSILDIVLNNRNICEWFHLPLQSGNDRVLKMMNRQYTKEHYLGLIHEIRRRIPEATLTTDVIAGFPTETDDEFRETLDVMAAVKFDDAYMYCYSPRPGTQAADLEALLEPAVKERLRQLIDLQGAITKERALTMIGKRFEVLFETPAKNGTRGKTRGNKDVIVEQVIEPGAVHEVLIKRLQGRTPVGEICRSIE